MNKKIFLLFYFSLFIFQIKAQKTIPNKPQKPYSISKPSKIERIPSLASRMISLKRPHLTEATEMKDGRSSKHDVLPGKGTQGDDILSKKPHRLKNKIQSRMPELVFETGATNSEPTDPSGAVGPNHYISVTNTAFQIFDKQGNSLTGGLVSPNPTIFPSGGCCDLTASYDNNADRWILSFLNTSNGFVQVAVSDGPDPINDGWTVYTSTAVSDYQKLSVWRDGYYMTENTASGNKLHVFERSAMIDAASAGTTPQILSFSMPGLVTSGFHSFQALNISNGDWPTTGGATIVYMQDDAWAGVDNDHIKIWTATMDWANPSNSEVSAAVELGNIEGVTPFTAVFDGGGISNLQQPNGGASIDALQSTIMNQAQYRKFPTHNSAVFNFVVDVDGSATNQAGVRWYELRQNSDGEPWSIHQEGTYTAPDNKHAWNASLIMDVQGNIGMGYTSMSSPNSSDSNVRVGSYYTGRMSNDPLGVMTVAETEIRAGNANIPTFRYGDYSKIDIDPDGDKKFWFVNELMSSGRKNYVGVFQLAANTNNDIGIISIDNPNNGSLTNTEAITVTVFNFGQNEASNFEVTYQVDGGTLITETFTGTLASQASEQYTFTTTADLSTEGQTYSIVSSTNLSGDEDNTNNTTSEQVNHAFINDIGVTEITTPISGGFLENEAVTITVKNFGSSSQSNFNVSYTIDNGTPIVETIPGPLAPQSTLSYTFNTTGDFSNYRDYILNTTTLLTNDSFTNNNSIQATITNSSCINTDNTTSMSIGPNQGDVTESIITITDVFTITDINVTLNLEHSFNGDMEIKLIAPNNNEVILSNRRGNSSDNFTNTVFDDEATNPISVGTGPFTGTFQPDDSLADLLSSSSNGDWKLVITDNANADGGNLLNWTLELCAINTLSVDKFLLGGDFSISTEDNNFFDIKLDTQDINEKLNLNIYNVIGQQVLWKTLEKEGSTYQYNLNMSYAASGVYIVKIGKGNKYNSAKIIVK